MAKNGRGVPTTGSERWQHLQEQIGFLIRSCRDFDDGHLSEAKRMANEVVKLVLNERHFRSVLHQVGLMPGMGFISTVDPTLPRPQNLAGAHLLIVSAVGDRCSYLAPTDRVPLPPNRRARIHLFESWWNEPVISLPGGVATFSRRDVVRSLRDQQGGAHVDPDLDVGMADLKRNNPMDFTWQVAGAGPVKLHDVELHTMRQIAHETLQSISRKLHRGLEPQA